MDCRIVVELVDLVEELGLGDGFGKMDKFTADACLRVVS